MISDKEGICINLCKPYPSFEEWWSNGLAGKEQGTCRIATGFCETRFSGGRNRFPTFLLHYFRQGIDARKHVEPATDDFAAALVSLAKARL